ncbi:polysaccharide pyruvyl transferase family protein [Ruegeria sp. SCP11]|uniref:polysaccharide pyruvyl transferase family protein n=1 Tax=Ruegeria sp. SCP11 TaxID=3141378 RepID=UPI003334C28E
MTLRNEKCYSELARDLKEFSGGRKIVEIVNSGNWGDTLIRAGQAEFLADNGIEVDQISIFKLRKPETKKPALKALRSQLRAFFSNDVAIFTGSGAFREYFNRSNELAIAAKKFSKVLIMPSSVPFSLSLDPTRTVVWRRDKLESMTGAPNAKFCHDLAFYLDPRPRASSKKMGVLFRTDVETDGSSVPPGNLDLSQEGTHNSDPEEFLNRVGEYEIIYTNRLHVGIAGALLGREVHIFPNRNQKIHSIYECSLKPFYKNVHFHDEPPGTSEFLKAELRSA